MQKEKILVPKLRFPEFTEDWKVDSLKNYIEERKEKGKIEYPLYSLTIEDGIIPKSKRYEREHLVSDVNDAYKIMFENDFAFNPMNLRFGALKRHKSTFLVNVSKYYNVFYCTKLAEPNFFEYYLTTYNMIQYYNKMATGSLEEKKRVHYLDFVNFKIPIPKKTEQQKIANFLTSVDERIQTLEKKKSLLEQYKKGVMQKIFKQEIRFKDENGEEFPEWGLVKLKEVFKRSKLKNTDEKVKYVLTNSATKGIISQNDYFDKDIANQNNLQGYYIVEKDDFIYNPRISQSAPVGPFKRNKLAQGVMSPLYTVLTPQKGNLEFFEFYFGTTLWHKYMKAIANYGARHDRMNITMTDFENLPIPYPSLEEQTKIANFLSAIDKNIAVVNDKIEHTKNYKKGLLQQMFV